MPRPSLVEQACILPVRLIIWGVFPRMSDVESRLRVLLSASHSSPSLNVDVFSEKK